MAKSAPSKHHLAACVKQAKAEGYADLIVATKGRRVILSGMVNGALCHAVTVSEHRTADKALEQAIDAVRGGQNVGSADAESQREALKKFCVDLTERARQVADGEPPGEWPQLHSVTESSLRMEPLILLKKPWLMRRANASVRQKRKLPAPAIWKSAAARLWQRPRPSAT